MGAGQSEHMANDLEQTLGFIFYRCLPPGRQQAKTQNLHKNVNQKQ